MGTISLTDLTLDWVSVTNPDGTKTTVTYEPEIGRYYGVRFILSESDDDFPPLSVDKSWRWWDVFREDNTPQSKRGFIFPAPRLRRRQEKVSIIQTHKLKRRAYLQRLI